MNLIFHGRRCIYAIIVVDNIAVSFIHKEQLTFKDEDFKFEFCTPYVLEVLNKFRNKNHFFTNISDSLMKPKLNKNLIKLC